jgi:anti-sigma factor RsiW
MSAREREPTADELLAMAYADGELAPEARAQFEARLAREPALRGEVASQHALALLARASAPPEPLELERLRVEREPLQRGLLAAAWALLVLGAAALVLAGEIALWTSRSGLGVKFGVTALLTGLALLALRAARLRARTRHLDPYRDLKR